MLCLSEFEVRLSSLTLESPDEQSTRIVGNVRYSLKPRNKPIVDVSTVGLASRSANDPVDHYRPPDSTDSRRKRSHETPVIRSMTRMRRENGRHRALAGKNRVADDPDPGPEDVGIDSAKIAVGSCDGCTADCARQAPGITLKAARRGKLRVQQGRRSVGQRAAQRGKESRAKDLLFRPIGVHVEILPVGRPCVRGHGRDTNIRWTVTVVFKRRKRDQDVVAIVRRWLVGLQDLVKQGSVVGHASRDRSPGSR